jgi:hypothetical protein
MIIVLTTSLSANATQNSFTCSEVQAALNSTAHIFDGELRSYSTVEKSERTYADGGDTAVGFLRELFQYKCMGQQVPTTPEPSSGRQN